MTHELKLTFDELSVLRMGYCGGYISGTPAVRSKLYDKIEALYREAMKETAVTLDGKDGRTTSGSDVDAGAVSRDKGRARRA